MKKIPDIFGKDLPLLEIKDGKLYVDGKQLDHTNVISYKTNEIDTGFVKCSIEFIFRTQTPL